MYGIDLQPVSTLMRNRIRFFHSDRIRIPCISDADPAASRNDEDPDTPHFSQLHRETSSSVTQTQQDSQTSTFCRRMCYLVRKSHASQ
jgi:hypothetical protein